MTNVLLFLLVAPTLGVFFSTRTASQGWRGVLPLHSTRAEVDQLLGLPENTPRCDKALCSYHLKDAIVQLNYSPGDCKSGRGEWDVPKDTVLFVTVYPKEPPTLAHLNIDVTKFNKKQDIGDAFILTNEEEGLSFRIYRGRVESLSYGPPAKDKHLRCPDRIIFPEGIPKELQARLLERITQFVEYSRTEQYEKQYELYFPEFAAKMFPVKSKGEYAQWVRGQRELIDSWIAFTPTRISAIDSDAYGNIYLIYGRAKTLRDGKVVESYRRTTAIIRNGEWYFVDLFHLLPL